MVSSLTLALALISSLSAFAHPVAHHPEHDTVRVIGKSQSSVLNLKRQEPAPTDASVFKVLVDGNQAFRQSDPELLKTLTEEGQSPPFMFLGCSDSRVNEANVFNTKPGTFFSQRNIANQWHNNDANAESVLAYGVTVLGVQHVIVMGHYGCGGVAAAIASPPSSDIDAAGAVVQNWIKPIRDQFESSTRPEIVALREKNKGNTTVEEPEVNEPGFRALVEENVKLTVSKIAENNIIKNHFATLAKQSTSPAPEAKAESAEAKSSHYKRADHAATPGNVFIHGWVYDIENGEVKDLGVSVGPAGVPIPAPPFAALSGAISATAAEASAESTGAASSAGAAVTSVGMTYEPLRQPAARRTLQLFGRRR
jgi:carbonic anhydrase